MRSNKRYIFFGVAGGAILLLLIYVFASSSVSWDENLDHDNREPYGTYVIRQLLEGVRNEQGFVFVDDSLAKRLPTDPSTNKVDNYVFLGNAFYGDATDLQAVMQFVNAGNNAYILMEDPDLFFDALLDLGQVVKPEEELNLEEDEAEYEYIQEDEVDRRFVYSYEDTLLRMSIWDRDNVEWKFDLRKYQDHKVIQKIWSYLEIDEDLRSIKGISTIGTFDGYVNNSIVVPHGRGKFFFHVTPLVFTNFFLKQRDGMAYARGFMSHLGDGIVYWDDENTIYQWKQKGEARTSNRIGKPEEGPLEFVLSQKNLRRAWYFLLLGVLIYVFFAARRRQRAVRSIAQPRNTSIEFAEVVSQLFLKQRDHSKLIRMKMDLWRAHARERYRIVWPDSEFLMKSDHAPELSNKSGLPVEKIIDLIESYNALLMAGTVDTEAMLEMHNKLEYYYQNCK